AHLAHLDLEGAAGQFHLVDLVVGECLFAGAEFDCHLVTSLFIQALWAPAFQGRPPRAIAISPAPKPQLGPSIYCCNTQRRPCLPMFDPYPGGQNKKAGTCAWRLPLVHCNYLRRPSVAI